MILKEILFSKGNCAEMPVCRRHPGSALALGYVLLSLMLMSSLSFCLVRSKRGIQLPSPHGVLLILRLQYVLTLFVPLVI